MGVQCLHVRYRLADLLGPLPGDCNDDGSVTVDELIAMVTIYLGGAPATACTTGDLDGSGTITVEEIVGAVNVALNECA